MNLFYNGRDPVRQPINSKKRPLAEPKNAPYPESTI
jgi:hypothetical protein